MVKTKEGTNMRTKKSLIQSNIDSKINNKNNENNEFMENNSTNKLGINDPNGIYNNPLTNEPYKNLYSDEIKNINGEMLPATYSNLAKIWTDKIVYNNKDKLIETISNNQVTLATAGTGVGKTILIPRIALHALNYKGKVVCTVPKRLPARNNASFVAQCMDVKIGEHVGYSYQGTNETNKNGIETKLIFTTTGSILSRMTGNDPLLSNYSCIIVDEAHERSVETDQLLLLLKKVCQIRKDLKLIIMSATISLEKFRNYYPSSLFKFGEVDAGSETTHEVKQYFMDKPDDWKKTAVDITMKLLKKTADGDIMIFVKSAGDANIIITGIEKSMSDFRNEFVKNRKLSMKKIGSVTKTKKHNTVASRTASRTASKTSKASLKQLEASSYVINPFCVKLEGSSSKEEATLATNMNLFKTKKNEKGYPYTRKIVVTTNVAESSITVDGIVYIIDSGYEYEESYEPNTRARALLEKMISQSAVKQRKGRAGRTRPGVCFHLYSKKDYERFREYPTPSIEKSDITGNILDIMRMEASDTVKKMRYLLDEFMDPPHEKFIINSLKTLEALGAITTLNEDGIITPMGSAISKFRVISPCFARSIIASHFYGVSRSMCDIIALAHNADGRIGNFFIKYYPDKKKTVEWNKKELNRHKSIMKSFEHPYGDYMSMLKAYKMYIAFIKTNTKQSISKINPKQDKADKVDKAVLDLDLDLNEMDDINTGGTDIKESRGTEALARKWCRDHYLNARVLADVKQNSMQFYRTLQEIMKPYQYVKIDEIDKDRKGGKGGKDGKDRKLTKKEKEDIKESITIMEINSVLDELEPNIPISNMNMNINNDPDIVLQSGGFIRRIAKEEDMQKLEPNVKRFEKEDDNIMMALAIGNFVNISTLGGGQRDMYVSCFANKKTPCKIDRDSFVRGNPKYVLFEEIFMSSEDARVLKLNMVNVLPNNVWERVKNEYGKFIKFCS